MSSVNVNISVNSLPQVDRYQNDIHKNPIVNQEQNAKIANNELAQRMNMPVQAEHAEGQLVDPNQKRIEADSKKKKKRERKDESNRQNRKPRGGDGGLMVDVEA